MQLFPHHEPEPTELDLLELLQSSAAPGDGALAAEAGAEASGAQRWLRRGMGRRGTRSSAGDGLEAGLTALVELRLDRQGAEHIEAFEERAIADAAVQQVWRVSPGPDFVLVVHCADMAGYHALTKRLFRQKSNVRNVKTRFAIRRAKASHRTGSRRGRHHADAHGSGEADRLHGFARRGLGAGAGWGWPDPERYALDVPHVPRAPTASRGEDQFAWVPAGAAAVPPPWARALAWDAGSMHRHAAGFAATGQGWRADEASPAWQRLALFAPAADALVQAMPRGLFDGVILDLQVPHVFVAEVRALAA